MIHVLMRIVRALFHIRTVKNTLFYNIAIDACLIRSLSKIPKNVFKTNYRLMQFRSIAECSILQHFRPSFSYRLSLRSLFCLCFSGRLRQVLE